jgi:hypothetical protein
MNGGYNVTEIARPVTYAQTDKSHAGNGAGCPGRGSERGGIPAPDGQQDETEGGSQRTPPASVSHRTEGQIWPKVAPDTD